MHIRCITECGRQLGGSKAAATRETDARPAIRVTADWHCAGGTAMMRTSVPVAYAYAGRPTARQVPRYEPVVL